VRHGHLLPLLQLTIVDLREQTHGAANVYYAEAQAFVSYLIDEYGPHRFKKFILSLADGKTFEDALEHAYKPDFKNLTEFERNFVEKISG